MTTDGQVQRRGGSSLHPDSQRPIACRRKPARHHPHVGSEVRIGTQTDRHRSGAPSGRRVGPSGNGANDIDHTIRKGRRKQVIGGCGLRARIRRERQADLGRLGGRRRQRQSIDDAVALSRRTPGHDRHRKGKEGQHTKQCQHHQALGHRTPKHPTSRQLVPSAHSGEDLAGHRATTLSVHTASGPDNLLWRPATISLRRPACLGVDPHDRGRAGGPGSPGGGVFGFNCPGGMARLHSPCSPWPLGAVSGALDAHLREDVVGARITPGKFSSTGSEVTGSFGGRSGLSWDIRGAPQRMACRSTTRNQAPDRPRQTWPPPPQIAVSIAISARSPIPLR